MLSNDHLNKRLTLLISLSVAIAIGILVFMVSLLLERVAGLIAMIILAVFLAYLMAPTATLLEKHGVRRSIGVLTIYFSTAVCVFAIGAYTVPRMALEATELVQHSPATTHEIEQRMRTASQNPFLARVPADLRDAIAHNVGAIEAYAERGAAVIGSYTVGGFRTVAEDALRGVIVLLLAFFLLTDAERIAITFLRPVPREWRAIVMEWLVDFDAVVGGFIRGQLLLAGIATACVTVLLFALGIQYALLLGMFAGVASILPIIGPIIGAVPAILVAVATVGTVKTTILILALVVFFEIQGHVLVPIVIGRAIKVTSMVVFVAILAGAEIYGLLGTLLAIPVAGVLRVALDRLFPTDPEIETLVHRMLHFPVKRTRARFVAHPKHIDRSLL
jgi:predicted PurR-regulated permease PerM